MQPRKSFVLVVAFAAPLAFATTASGENCTRCEQGESQPWVCAATSVKGVCLRENNVCVTIGGICEATEHTLDGTAAGSITGDLLEGLPAEPAAIAAALAEDGPVRLRYDDGVSTLHRTCDGAVLALAFEPGAEDAFLRATSNLVI